MNSEKPVIIVGAGLAGLSIAIRLIDQGKRVIVYDNGVNYSSIIAAGMINPLVFRRMTKSWRVDDCVAELNSFYSDLENKTEASFHHNIQIRRMFSNEHERELWLEKQELAAYAAYMEKTTSDDDNYSRAINNFGSGRVKNASYVDTKTFLDTAKHYVSQNGTLVLETFDYSLLKQDSYKDVSFDAIVFCEGYLGVSNPYFNYLPLQQTKGETLTITSEFLPENESVNRKCFVLPLGNGEFKVGSTYVWSTPDTTITEEGKKTILGNLAYLTDEDVFVKDQNAGVRPTTPDRRPMMGQHPEFRRYYIFNGLGTKGYLLAPLMSKEFVAYLTEEMELNAEVRIERFAKHLFTGLK